jgi:hypothetical protein
MAAKGGGWAGEIRMEVVLRDGSTAAVYRLAPPWERTESTGGGAAAAPTVAAALTGATASRTAVPAQAARLVLTIAIAGTTYSISLLPPGEDGEASLAQSTTSMSIHLHPMEDRAAVRVYTIAGILGSLITVMAFIQRFLLVPSVCEILLSLGNFY